MSHQHDQQPRQGPMGQQPTRATNESGMTGQETGGQGMSGQQPIGGGQQTGGQRTRGSQGTGGQQPMTGGQGMGGQRMGGGQQMGGRGATGQPSFEDHLTNELRIALEDFTELSHIADWCAKTCASEGPQLATCAAMCRDIAELAEFNEKLIARDSMFGPEIADTFIRIARESLPELRQYQHHPHVAETISAIDRAIDSATTLLEMVGTQETGGGQMMGSQGTGSRQMSGGQGPGTPQAGGQMGSQGTGGRQMGDQR